MSSNVTLGITTSGPVAAAVIIGNAAVDQRSTGAASDKPALAGTLASVMEVLRAANISLDAVDLIAVCTGPGSFTGLRIGVAFAKSVAQARSIPIAGVSAYDVAAYDMKPAIYPRASIVEGKRGYSYARILGAADTPAEFIHGPTEDVQRALYAHACARLADVPAQERTLRVALIGRARFAAGEDAAWRSVVIDYGQQPNAVTNWEARRSTPQRGGGPSAANHRRHR